MSSDQEQQSEFAILATYEHKQMRGGRKKSLLANGNPISILTAIVRVSTWPRDYKTFFVLNSAMHEFSTANLS